MALIFLAVAWAVGAMIVIFLVAPYVWESLFGKAGAAIAAVVAMCLAVWISARMMRVADHLLGEGSGQHSAEPALDGANVDVVTDWRAYSADIIRNKRWAFYRRTRQFERLAELEAQSEPAPGD